MANLSPATQTAQQALTAARHLAAAGEAHQYLTFTLSGEMYAVGILKHRQENESDPSVMPYNLPYQYVDFVIADCLGVAP